MELDDLILVSVDDHVIEPPDLFTNHLPASLVDRAPRLVRRDDGADVWVFGGEVAETSAMAAVAGRPKSEYGRDPQGLDDIRPGCFDVHERVKDMDAGGVLASMNFPTYPTFTGRRLIADDLELSLALIRAYNDWHIDEWCGAYPGRFIPMALPVLWDVELAADEVRRCAAKGCHSLSFSENPASLGFASFHNAYWDPLWEACCDTGTVVSMHLGSSGKLLIPTDDGPPDVMITLQPMNISCAAADVLWSRVPKRFPDIRFALSEGGIGWIPYFLERVDRTFDMHHEWTGQDFSGKLPSEVFREHFLTCFINDPSGLDLRHKIGIDNIAWEADYPHPDGLWPDAPEDLHRELTRAGVTDDEAGKMTYGNALRWYSFDPFAHIPKEEATVGALRRRAAGHDVSIMTGAQRRSVGGPWLQQHRERADKVLAAAGAHAPDVVA
jgi:predicted TIM-barrel fold metal-dependent hydrolase